MKPFSNTIAFVCMPIDGSAILRPEETSLIERATSRSRQAEVTAGRDAARRALAALGIARPGAILRDESGAPVWPEGICGSISHTKRFAAAAVARTSTTALLGLDLEERSRIISEAALDRIASPDERLWVQTTNSADRALQLFTAKEAWYKAIYPRIRRVVDFMAVRAVPFGSHSLELHAAIDIPGIHQPLVAYTVFSDDLVVSGVEFACHDCAE